MVSKFEMIPLILLTFFEAVPCGGSALLASMQEWRAGLFPEFYLILINSRRQIPFYAVVKGILFKQSSVSRAMGLLFFFFWKFQCTCLSQEHELLVLLELETLTDKVHKEEGLIQHTLQML